MAAAHGSAAVHAATIAPLEGDGKLTKRRTRLECDLLLVSMGWTPNTGLAYQAGVKFGYDDSRAELRANNLPENFAIVGRAAGAHVLEHEMSEGALAGRRMAAVAARVELTRPLSVEVLFSRDWRAPEGGEYGPSSTLLFTVEAAWSTAK